MQDAQLIQSIEAFVAQRSYDHSRAYGDRILNVEGERVLIAQVSTAEDYARSWVVTLAPATVPSLEGAVAGGFQGAVVPQLLADAFAIVEWGRGSSATWAIVDWTYGQQFSVYGSFVRVSAGLTAFGTAGANPTPDTRFAGHITPGYSARRPVRTVLYGGPITAGTAISLPLPAYAQHVAVSGVVADADLATMRVNGQLVSAGAPTWSAQPGVTAIGIVDPNFMVRPFPLPIGTTFLELAMIAGPGGAWTTPRARYELGLT